MAPYKLKSTTLSTLRTTRSGMLSAEFQLSLLAKPKNDRKRISLQLSAVQVAILRLEAAELSDIRDSLIEESDSLKSSTSELKAELENLNKVEEIASSISQLLTIVGRIVSLVA